MDVLFSIKPCYAEQIFEGTKKYEFRKVCCRKNVRKAYIYSEKDYFEYFRGRKNAVAYELTEVVRYKEPKQLACLNLKKPPQSFCYI